MRTADELVADVGRRVAELRHRLGLTQQGLAERLGVSEQYLRRIEGGRANLSLRSLAKVAAVLGVDGRELLLPPRARSPRLPGRPPRR